MTVILGDTSNLLKLTNLLNLCHFSLNKIFFIHIYWVVVRLVYVLVCKTKQTGSIPVLPSIIYTGLWLSWFKAPPLQGGDRWFESNQPYKLTTVIMESYFDFQLIRLEHMSIKHVVVGSNPAKSILYSLSVDILCQFYIFGSVVEMVNTGD